MFEEAQKQSDIKQADKKESPLSDFIIHVMPVSFREKKIVAKEEKKPVVKPVIKELPKQLKPISAMPVAKKSSRIPWILGAVGIVLILSLLVIGIYAIKSFQPEPVVVIDETPETVVEPIVEVPQEIVAGNDLDSDGLTDVEEAMYGTNPRNPDSDNDTFLDGNEVFHRYSPLGTAPQTLLDTGAVKEYLSKDGSFTLTYPTQWTVAGVVDSSLEQTEEIVFRTNSTATVRLVLSKLADETFDQWYMKNALDGRTVQLETTLTKQGYVAHQSPDDLVAYVIAGDSVFTFHYDLADEKEIVYMQTFQMMINSFSMLP
ncbi:MAG: thrombospondin type 3 repeat-containing protein [Patescibacteria group bacterium]